MQPQLLNQQEKAAALNVSIETLRRWYKRGVGPECIQYMGTLRYLPEPHLSRQLMPPRLSVTLLTVWPHPHKPRLKLLRVWTARLKKSIPRKRRSAIFPSTVDQLRGQTADVLVAHKVLGTHDTVSLQSMNWQFHLVLNWLFMVITTKQSQHVLRDMPLPCGAWAWLKFGIQVKSPSIELTLGRLWTIV